MVGIMENDAKPTATASVLESGPGSESCHGLDKHPASLSVEDDQCTHAKELTHSSSSSSSGSDLLELNPDKLNLSLAGDSGSQEPDRDGELGSEDKGNETAVSSTLCQEKHGSQDHANNESATESPPPQLMERTSDSNPSKEPYRIPSYVFDKTDTNAATEWSVASNDSLFSIYMGNMSFTRDNLSCISKSGELSVYGDSPLIDYSSNEPPSSQLKTSEVTETGKPHSRMEERFGVTESKAAETMREVIKENEDKGGQKSLSNALPRCYSDASVKSFAFPILTGNDKSGSGNPSSQPPTPKTPSQPPIQPQTQPQTPEAGGPLKASPTFARVRWCSCFSWCSQR